MGSVVVVIDEVFEPFVGEVIEGVEGGAVDDVVVRGAPDPFDFAVIGHEIRRRLVVRLFPEGNWRYGEPIRDTGAPGARRCGQAADRQWGREPEPGTKHLADCGAR